MKRGDSLGYTAREALSRLASCCVFNEEERGDSSTATTREALSRLAVANQDTLASLG
jgi:hypothetical protein